MGLSTGFKDDVISGDGLRKYNMIQNSDGTVSFEDVTNYSQIGSSYGAKEVNEERAAINDISNKIIHQMANVSSVKNLKFARGTRVYSVNSATSLELFTFSELNSLFGATDCSQNNTMLFVSNGDGDARDTHVDGATCVPSKSAWFATFDRSTTGNIRINYLVVYFGDTATSSTIGIEDGDEVSY